MDDNGNSLINLQPAADIANNIINKVSDAIGWFAMPKGSKKDMEVAVENYIAEIQRDNTLPSIVRAAKITRARREIREYINTQDILLHAQKFEAMNQNTESLDNDWAMFFFENAKNVSREDAKILWGKVLAQKCSGNQAISKQLIMILSMMSSEEAQLFNTICNLGTELVCENYPNMQISPLFYETKDIDLMNQLGISYYGLKNLDALGLIKYDGNCVGVKLGDNVSSIKLIYFDKKIEVSGVKDNLPVGNLILTFAGMTLADLIVHTKVENYEEYIKTYYESYNYKVAIT